jgi:hypothetical protein
MKFQAGARRKEYISGRGGDGGRNYQIKTIDLCDIHHYYQIDWLERETQGT